MKKVSIEKIRSFKGREQLPVLTAYDYPMAKLLDELGMPMLLVGDSLGMVVLGYPDTTHVTMEDMEHHVRSVARAKPASLIVADLPYGSCEILETAVSNSRRLLDAGADAVKAEGALSIETQIRAIAAAGIPFMGHIGMLPQRVQEEGGYRIKGKAEEEKMRLIQEAVLLDGLGAFAIVLELVSPSAAAAITQRVQCPTIGIGSGTECDGQILVIHDLVGGFPWFTPRFVKPQLNAAQLIKEAIQRWRQEVRSLQNAAQPKSARLTHISRSGEAAMVDVSRKPVSLRSARAGAAVFLRPETIQLIQSDEIAKGNVLATARLAGILAAKKTGELIPLAHPLPLAHAEVLFETPASRDRILIFATAKIAAQTGVEMEALTAVGVAALTIYDMCKAVDPEMRIGDIRLISKEKIPAKQASSALTSSNKSP